MKSIFYDNFEIKTFPTPPTGINQGTSAPPPELIQTASTTVLDLRTNAQRAFYIQWQSLLASEALVQGEPTVFRDLILAKEKGITNFASPAWKAAEDVLKAFPVAKIEQNIFSRRIRLAAKARWEQIYGDYNQGGTSEFGQSVTEGVTTTTTQQSHWSLSIGLSATVDFGFVSATMSTNFSTGGSTSHAISVNKSTTRTHTFSIPAQSYAQIWQLVVGFEAGGDSSNILEMKVPRFQLLTYPHNALVMSDDVVTQEELDTIRGATEQPA